MNMMQRSLHAEKEIADYFESVIHHTKNYKAVANWINGPIKQLMNDEEFL